MDKVEELELEIMELEDRIEKSRFEPEKTFWVDKIKLLKQEITKIQEGEPKYENVIHADDPFVIDRDNESDDKPADVPVPVDDNAIVRVVM